MDLSVEQQIELLGIMKHWVVATQNDKTTNGNYMVVGKDSFEQQSLGNPYDLVETIENLRGHLFSREFMEFKRILVDKVKVDDGVYIRTRKILNTLFDDMVRQVNVRNQRNDTKYKMLYLTFIDFLDNLSKTK